MLVPLKLFLEKIDMKLVSTHETNKVSIDGILEEINVVLDLEEYLDLKLNEEG